MTETQVLFRALAEAYAQLDFARAELAHLKALSATESTPETGGGQ